MLVDRIIHLATEGTLVYPEAPGPQALFRLIRTNIRCNVCGFLVELWDYPPGVVDQYGDGGLQVTCGNRECGGPELYPTGRHRLGELASSPGLRLVGEIWDAPDVDIGPLLGAADEYTGG